MIGNVRIKVLIFAFLGCDCKECYTILAVRDKEGTYLNVVKWGKKAKYKDLF